MINSESVVLDDDFLDTNHIESMLSEITPLILSKKKVKCQNC